MAAPRRVLMITDDVWQLDRRIVQEALTLGAAGWSCDILAIDSRLQRPEALPAGIGWALSSAGEMQGVVKTSLRDAAWKLGMRLGLTGLLQALQASLRDPARRRTQSIAASLGSLQHQLIFAHSLLVLPLAIELRRRVPGARVVFDAHEVFDEQRDSLRSAWVRRYWRGVGDEYAPQADGVSTVTPRIARALQQRHRLDKVPVVLYNACAYRPGVGKTGLLHQLYSIDPSRRIALCQGGLLPGRGLEDVAEAAPELDRHGVALVFLGTGPADHQQELRARSQGKAHLGKSVSQEALLDHTADADLGLISNRGGGLNNTAGGPNRLFEYLQARVPVLSHEHDGIRDVLSETGTGWTVPWSGGRALAARVLEKLDEARAIPAERLEAAARTFSWEGQEPALLELVRSVS